MLTGVVYAIAAAQLMKMIYVSSAHQATNTAEIDSASSLYHDYVSLHFYLMAWADRGFLVCHPEAAGECANHASKVQ